MLKFMAQLNVAPIGYTIGLGGGHGNYPAPGIPASWLIGVDGKVIWAGHPASLPEKLLTEELKKVKLTDEAKAARAEKAYGYAESLLGAKQYLQGVALLDRILKEHKGTEAAKKAEAKKAELDGDEAAKKEIAAQKTLDKIVGGLELPKEKLKGKERDAKKVQLEAFIRKNKEDAPGASDLASLWVKVMAEDWKAEK